MLGEFQCKDCGTQFVVAFTTRVEPGKPIRHCIVCGKDHLLPIRMGYGKEELRRTQPAVDVQMGGGETVEIEEIIKDLEALRGVAYGDFGAAQANFDNWKESDDIELRKMSERVLLVKQRNVVISEVLVELMKAVQERFNL